MEGKVIEWAVAVIGAAPPVQNVAAFLVVLLAVVPLLWSGIKRFRSPEPAQRQEELIQQTPWLIQAITTIEMDIQGLKRAVETNGAAAKDIGESVQSVDRMVRKIHTRLFDSHEDRRS